MNIPVGNVAVPGLQHIFSDICGHKFQKIALRLDPQSIHVQTDGQLVAHGAIDIKTGHQGIIDPFKQGVINEPHGARQFPENPLVG